MNNVMKDFTFSTVPEIIVEWAGASRAGRLFSRDLARVACCW